MTKFATWLSRLAAGSAAGVAAIALAQPAVGQAPRPAPRTEKAAPRTEKPAAPGEVREEARDAADDIRDAARETAEGARKTGQDTRREARETVREGREEGREVRREGREAAREGRDFATSRPADFGLWFNSRAGADGLVIADVSAEGAISKIGFREGDRIVSINGQKVADEREFMRYLMADDLRTQRVKVIVFRGGREQILYVQPSVLVTEVVDYDPLWRYGIVIDDRYPDRIVVLRVYPRTPAYYSGLRAGDVVVGLRGQRVGAVADLVRAFSDADGRVALQVSRGRQTRELEIDASGEADADVRTTLRPDIDGGPRVNGRTRTRVEGDVEGRTETPADDKPSLDKPTTDKPATDKPRTDKPRTEKPATDAPATDEPAAPKPRVEKPATPRVEAPAAPREPKPATPAPKPTAPEVPDVPPAPAPEAPKLPDAPKLP